MLLCQNWEKESDERKKNKNTMDNMHEDSYFEHSPKILKDKKETHNKTKDVQWK